MKPLILISPCNGMGFTKGKYYAVLSMMNKDGHFGRKFVVKNDYGNEVSVYEKRSSAIYGNDFEVMNNWYIVLGVFVAVTAIILGTCVISAIAYYGQKLFNHECRSKKIPAWKFAS